MFFVLFSDWLNKKAKCFGFLPTEVILYCFGLSQLVTRVVFVKNTVSFQELFGKETSESEDSSEPRETGTGKWKVPTYKDYLYLFRSLLNCDTMKVKA